MFTLLFYALAEVGIFIVGVYVIYKLFFAKKFQYKALKKSEEKDKFNSANKIAQLKLVSDNPKDIESFIIENAKYLSEGIVKQLVQRIEALECDRILYEEEIKDNPLSNIKRKHTEYVERKL